jgi:hypothetical protein
MKWWRGSSHSGGTGGRDDVFAGSVGGRAVVSVDGVLSDGILSILIFLWWIVAIWLE